MQRNHKTSRPVDAGLFHLRLPVGAVVSVLHRISGVALALLFPGALWILDRSLSGPAAFDQVRAELNRPMSRVGVAVCVWLLAHHFYAGVRHLLLDLDVGSARRPARWSAYAVLVLGAITTAWVAL